MSQLQFLTLLQMMLVLVIELSAPILIVCLVVGLIISIFQSVTQIQESTLTFVPKILAGFLVLIMLAPWMLQVYIFNVTQLFENMQNYIH